MATFRTVKTSFWTDRKIVDEFSPEDRYFFLYLLTNPKTTQLGIYEFVPRVAAFDLGYSQDAVKVLLDRFENKYNIIRYSKETGEIAIKNYLLHSIIKGGKPVKDCLEKEEKMVKDKSLVVYVARNLRGDKRINETVRAFIESVVDTYSDENENDKENNNDNERIVAYDSLKLKQMVIYDAIILPDRGSFKCEWCGNKVDVLEKHHFPIPKSMHGTEVVRICHDCHAKFHKLEYQNNMGVYHTDSHKKEPSVDDLADELFETLWSMYPKKRGKGSVSATQKRRMYEIGYDSMARCIDRYKQEIQGKDEKYIKMGSTFFNSGYIDYLDENYVPPRDTSNDAILAFLAEDD